MTTCWPKDVVALTGCVAAGKSTVLKQFQCLGAFTVSADELAREVVSPGRPELERIRQIFGKEIINRDGTLNRKALGGIVFNDVEARLTLEAILHPAIRELAQSRFKEVDKDKFSALIYEVPLFFETGMQDLDFKAIISVVCDEATSLTRMISRDGITKDEAQKRLSAQLPASKKAELADYVIENNLDTDKHYLTTEVERILNSLASDARQK